MKISNETKVGVIALVSITVLILGFNFLKGKKFFSKNTTLFGVFSNVQGLQNSNPIVINGLQVGTVYKISTDQDMRKIRVELNITKDIHIPVNSIATIKPNPIGTTSLEIKLGDATEYLKNKGTIFTEANAGLFDEVLKKVDPVLYEVKRAVASMDTLLHNINGVIDPGAKNNISHILENLNRMTTSLVYTSASLQQLLNTQTGALAKTLNNLNAVSGNLAGNNEKINNVFTNLDKTTTKLSQLDLQKTLNTLDATVNDLNRIVARVGSDSGTLGKFINDTKLYDNLASTGNKLNLLIDDIRVNPKRYVSISVFGKKQTNPPLVVPTPDTLHSPYYIRKIND